MTDFTEAKKSLLEEWERRRDELDVLIRALRSELGMTASDTMKVEYPSAPTAGGVNVNELVKPGDFFGMTQVEAIETFLQRTNRQTVTLQEIAGALYRGKATDSLIEGEKRLRNLSSLLSKTDIFYSVARGRWGLTEWYPARLMKIKKGKSNGSEPNDSQVEKTSEAAGGAK
jgi:hypothetical protein